MDTALHLVREEPANDAAALLGQVESLQSELDNLNQEVTHLRSRDQTINLYMHRMDEELRLAARLQRDFLPKTLPTLGKATFQALYRPAGYVSGDLYDIFRLDEFHLGFYVADAVGHGVPAALLTMFIKNALITKEITPGGYRLLPPGDSMGRLNEMLLAQNLSQATFATAVYGMIDTRTHLVTFSRAGHPCPMLMPTDASQPSRDLACDGSLLGIFPDEKFAVSTIQLEPGDRLMVYTDGIEVAFGDLSETESGSWRNVLEELRGLPKDQFMTRLEAALDQQSGSLTPQDDLTIVLLEIAA